MPKPGKIKGAWGLGETAGSLRRNRWILLCASVVGAAPTDNTLAATPELEAWSTGPWFETGIAGAGASGSWLEAGATVPEVKPCAAGS